MISDFCECAIPQNDNGTSCSRCIRPINQARLTAGNSERNSKFCTNCGGLLIEANKFCGYCGTQIILDSNTRHTQSTSDSNSKYWATAGLFAVVIIGVLFFTGQFSKNSVQSQGSKVNQSDYSQISGQIYYYYPNTSSCNLMSDISGKIYNGKDELLGTAIVDGASAVLTDSKIVDGYTYHYCAVDYSSGSFRSEGGPLQIVLEHGVTSSGATHWVIDEQVWKSGTVNLNNR